jgi:DNA-directed RNA polymerase specialized sigma24 family protein
MGDVLNLGLRVSLRAAACMLAGDARDPVAGERVRRAVDAQLRRAGVEAQDRDDVRTDVVLALLCAPAADVPLPLELVCARAAVIARNKAIDHGRRRSRAPLALGDALPEPEQPDVRPGSLADVLDEVAALAHRRNVRRSPPGPHDRLDAPQRAAISAHAEGRAAHAAGLPRSTYYRVLARAQARLRSVCGGASRHRRSAAPRSARGRSSTSGSAERRPRPRRRSRSRQRSCWAATTACPPPSPAAVVAAVAVGGRVAPAPVCSRRPPHALRVLRRPPSCAESPPATASVAAATPSSFVHL